MKYDVEIGSGVMVYIPNLIKTGSGTEKLVAGAHIQHGEALVSFYFIKIRQVS
jgi:hypothetical protein